MQTRSGRIPRCVSFKPLLFRLRSISFLLVIFSLKDRLKKFAEHVQEREARAEASAPLDPRSDAERVLAGELLARAAGLRAQMRIGGFLEIMQTRLIDPIFLF